MSWPWAQDIVVSPVLIWTLGDGVDVVTYGRTSSESPAKFDVMIATQMVEHSFAGMTPGDRAVLIAVTVSPCRRCTRYLCVAFRRRSPFGSTREAAGIA